MTAVAPPRAGAVLAALLAVQVLFALHYVASKWVLAEVDPFAWSAIRATAGAACLVPSAALLGCPFPRAPRDLAACAGVALLGVAVNQLCFVAGLALTTPGFSSVINVSIPVATLAIAWALRRERFDGRRALGLAAAAGGVMLLLSRGIRGEWREGNWLTFANALSFALFLVLSRPLYRRLHPYAATAVMFVFGAAALDVVGGAAALAVPWGALSGRAWAGMIYSVLGATVGTYALNAWALRHADASLVGFFIILQPLIATTLSALQGGEPLDVRFFGAAALVATGVLIVAAGARRRAA